MADDTRNNDMGMRGDTEDPTDPMTGDTGMTDDTADEDLNTGV